jgi:hypothetical protein
MSICLNVISWPFVSKYISEIIENNFCSLCMLRCVDGFSTSVHTQTFFFCKVAYTKHDVKCHELQY